MREYQVKIDPPQGGGDDEWQRRVEAVLDWLLKFRPRLWLLGGLTFVVVWFGTPHLLVTYHCYGHCTPARAYACDYFGVQGWRAGLEPVQGRCRIMRLVPLKT